MMTPVHGGLCSVGLYRSRAYWWGSQGSSVGMESDAILKSLLWLPLAQTQYCTSCLVFFCNGRIWGDQTGTNGLKACFIYICGPDLSLEDFIQFFGNEIKPSCTVVQVSKDRLMSSFICRLRDSKLRRHSGESSLDFRVQLIRELWELRRNSLEASPVLIAKFDNTFWDFTELSTFPRKNISIRISSPGMLTLTHRPSLVCSSKFHSVYQSFSDTAGPLLH